MNVSGNNGLLVNSDMNGEVLSGFQKSENGPELSSPTLSHRDLFSLILLTALFFLVYGPTIEWLIQRWSLGVWYHPHGFLVAPISGYLAWQTLQKYPDRVPSSFGYGFLLLVPALFLHIIDTALRSYLLSSISLVLAITGLSLLLLGTGRTRAIWFSLGFLLFMLPIPLGMVEGFRAVLQHITAVFSEHLLNISGVFVYREGNVIMTTRVPVTIADACSGFSTLTAMVFISSLYAYTGISGRWLRIFVLIISVPCAIAANTVRSYALILLILQFGVGILDTWVHSASGVMTFMLAFFLIVSITRGVSRIFAKKI